VLAMDVPGDQHIVVAASQQEVDLAVRDMRRIFLLLSLGALGVTGVLVYRLVGRSLRPLEEVERTAAVIATGDLSLRVPVRRPGSEVGRLAAAFNSMLGQIESAFLARADSEQAARRSEERMRRFVADASHELRTPLTSIRGYAELYRQGSVTDPEEVSRLLRRVEDEGARMGLLVDDLLLLARLDRQRPPTNDLVDLVVLAGDAVHDARAVDPGRPVGLRVDLPAGQEDGFALPVLGDEARLRQVLGNLVGNALTHTPPGTPVEVRLRAEGGDAVVEVADSGPGLPPEHAEHVFERFFRVDAGRSRAAGGTGLGLAIVAALVEAHGGRVEVRTAPGEGATFRVLLPRHADGGQVQRPDDGPA
jgi:two-component system, OmpR family, sensor kinase